MKNRELDLELYFNSFIDKNKKTNHWTFQYPNLKLEWDENRNKEIGISSILDVNNLQKNAWWVCSNCNNSYQSRILVKIKNYSKDSFSNCSFCNFKNSNEYKSVVKHWNFKKNGDLTFKPMGKEKFWFKFPNCTHETYTTFTNFVKGSMVCRECISINNKKTILEKAAKESAEISFLKSKSSVIERKLYYFLYLIFDTEVLSGDSFKAPGYKNTFEIDIYIKRLNLGIEYDGVYFHTDFNKDCSKNDKCKAAGIKLLRIREEGLEKISDDDIVYNHKNYDVNSLLNLVSDWLNIRYELNHKELSKIAELKSIDLNEYTIPIEFNIYPIKTNSVANKFPKLHNSWNKDLNVKFGLEFNLLNILPNSSLRNTNCFWTCKTCKLVWMDTISNRMKNDNCPKCEQEYGKEVNSYNNINDNLDIIKDFSSLNSCIKRAEIFKNKFLGPLKNKAMGLKSRKELRYSKLIINTIIDKLNHKNKEYENENGLIPEFRPRGKNSYFDASNELSNVIVDANKGIEISNNPIKITNSDLKPEHNELSYFVYYKNDWYITFKVLTKFYLKKSTTVFFTELKNNPDITKNSIKLKNYNLLHIGSIKNSLYVNLPDLREIKPDYNFFPLEENLLNYQIYYKNDWYVTFDSICEIFNKPPTTLLRLLKKHKIEHIKLNNFIGYKASDICKLKKEEKKIPYLPLDKKTSLSMEKEGIN